MSPKENQKSENQKIDFRKDTAPTDWLKRNVAKYKEFIDPELKSELDHFNDLIAELNGLRCAPVCHTATTAGNGCICSLVEQLASTENGLMPKGEFMAAIKAIGYSQKQSLEKYRIYATKKIGDQYRQEFDRLHIEGKNAYNWTMELKTFEASKVLDEVTLESTALLDKIDQEIEAAMSA